MYGLVSTALIVLCVLYVFMRSEPLISRALAIAERRAETYRSAILKPGIEDEEPMPRDFIDWAMNESTEWAKDAMLARMRELYSKFHDWEKVRIALANEIAINEVTTV